MHTLHSRNGCHFYDSQRRRELPEAVISLRELILRCVGIGVRILCHAAAGMLRVWVREAATVPYGRELVRGVMSHVRLRRGKAEAVDGRVGVADGAQCVGHFDVASMV